LNLDTNVEWHKICCSRFENTKIGLDMRSVLKAFGVYSLVVLTTACSNTAMRLPSLPLVSTEKNDSADVLNMSRSLLGERRSAETSEFYVPSISAIGFASVSIQPSKNINQRRLMAMRAAKLDAYRSLTEQIHGIRIQGETTIGEAVLTSDKLASALNGIIIGARTVKIEPTSNDTYQIHLEVSETHINRLVKAYRRGLI